MSERFLVAYHVQHGRESVTYRASEETIVHVHDFGPWEVARNFLDTIEVPQDGATIVLVRLRDNAVFVYPVQIKEKPVTITRKVAILRERV